MFNSGILILFDIIRALVFLGLKSTSHVFEISIHLVQVNVLRKLKFILSKQALSNIYLTFIRPVLEYAREVCDGCYERDIKKLEKIQLKL
jgi:hypothetical protein